VQDTWAKYLKEGMNVNLLTWNGKARVCDRSHAPRAWR
jgi:hypothetical protein